MGVAVKFCGITTVEDAIQAVDLGCSAIGLNFYEHSRRLVPLKTADEIVRSIDGTVKTVAVFVDPRVEEVVNVVEEVGVDFLQFHGHEPAAFCEQFQVPFVKAASVTEGFDFEEFSVKYHRAQALMLDSFRGLERGGTGRTFDWALWPKYVKQRIILAGGLDAANVAQAITQTNPWAVDVASGIEKDGGPAKDAQKMEAFMSEVRRVGT